MHEFSYLKDLIILLSTSIFMIAFFKQLKLSPVLGYLFAGAAMGPSGLGYIQSSEITTSIAEFGIVFLLFSIGLELTFDKLKSMRKYVVGFGGLQFLITTILLYFIATKTFLLDSGLSLIIASSLALSSTAIIMEVLSENSEKSTRVGRLSISALIMQDLAVIPILVLLPLLSMENADLGSAIGKASLNAILAFAMIFIVGRLFLRPLYRIIVATRNDALFLSTTLLVILGSATITNYMGMSFTLGAFIAGLMVAETEYKYRVESETSSFKSLLMGLFFVTVGMDFDGRFLIEKFDTILLLAAALIFVKAFIIIILCRIFKFPIAPSIHTGLLLCQGGEFAFVVFLEAQNMDIMPAYTAQLLITVVTVTMAFTPILAIIGSQIKRTIYVHEALKDNKLKRDIGDLSDHIIVIGYDKIGRIVTNLLNQKDIKYITLGNNYRSVQAGKENNHNVYYGDAMNKDILSSSGINNANSVIIAMEDDSTCLRITRFIHENFPHVNVVAKMDSNNKTRFRMLGAGSVVSPDMEASLQLAKNALLAIGADNKDIDVFLNEFRDLNDKIDKSNEE
ncbi:cation:proton antiporter [Rickettsiales bacterium]|nr:cation:proton antiporter [Rickettsiales bacterium]MDB2550404.1 cation:proton antiporter [Rickettsiales bacterium]